MDKYRTEIDAIIADNRKQRELLITDYKNQQIIDKRRRCRFDLFMLCVALVIITCILMLSR